MPPSGGGDDAPPPTFIPNNYSNPDINSSTPAPSASSSAFRKKAIQRSDTFIGVRPSKSVRAQGGGGGIGERKLSRGRTLTRPERHVNPAPLIDPRAAGQAQSGFKSPQQIPSVPLPRLISSSLTNKTVLDTNSGDSWWSPWTFFSKFVTLWAPGFMLSWLGGMKDGPTQQAWREKIALCVVILLMGGFVGFATVGLNAVLCPQDQSNTADKFIRVGSEPNLVGIGGWMFNTSGIPPNSKNGSIFTGLAGQDSGIDVTALFDRSKVAVHSCNGLNAKFATVSLCNTPNPELAPCSQGAFSQSNFKKLGLVNTTHQMETFSI